MASSSYVDDFNDELARRRDKAAMREDEEVRIIDDLMQLTPQQFDEVKRRVGTLHAAKRAREKARVN